MSKPQATKRQAIFIVRYRLKDTDRWSEPEKHATKRSRDAAALMARCDGVRVWTYRERYPATTKENV